MRRRRQRSDIAATRRRQCPEAIDALVAIGESAIPPLVRALARSNPLPAQRALARMRELSTPHLVSALKSSNRQVQVLAAAALGLSEDPAVPKILLESLKHRPDWINLGNALMQSIAKHRPLADHFLAEISKLLETAPGPLRPYVVEAAGFSLDVRFIAPLTRILHDEDQASSWQLGARALGFLAVGRASIGVFKALESRALDARPGWRYYSSRLEAIHAMGRLRIPAAEPILAELASVPMQRPSLAPATSSWEQVDRNLGEQSAWKVKVFARHALAHLIDSSATLTPPSDELGPL